MDANQLRFPAEERRLGKAGVDLSSFHAVVEAISDMVGPEPISRPELEQQLEARVGGWAITKKQGWVGIYKNWPVAVGWSAALGRVCYGPGQSGRISFVRLADWSGWRAEDPVEAGRWVVRRFLHAYGPSTRAEFSRWFALEPAIAKRFFEELADSLLPHFDVFVVGSHPRDQLMMPGSAIAAAMRLEASRP